jgi:hypothetical protein
MMQNGDNDKKANVPSFEDFLNLTLHSLKNGFGGFAPLICVSFELCIPLGMTSELFHLY